MTELLMMLVLIAFVLLLGLSTVTSVVMAVQALRRTEGALQELRQLGE